MNIVRENEYFLKALIKLPKKQVKSLLLNATKVQLRLLAEIAANILAGVLQISKTYKTQLKEQKRFIRRLANGALRSKDRKRLLLTKVEPTKTLVKAALEKL